MRYLKRTLIFITLILTIILFSKFPAVYAASEDEKIAESILDSYTDFYSEVFENGLKVFENNSPFEELITDFNIKDIFKKIVSGDMELSIREIFHLLIKCFLGEVYGCLKLMALVTALSVLCSYLTGLQEGFGKDGVNQAAFYACYIVIAGIASAAFCQAAGCVTNAVENISVFIKIIVPVVITTLLTSGAIVSAAVFEPIIITIVEIAVTTIQSLFVPLVMIAAAINIVNNISDKFKTQKMVKFINRCIKWGLSIMLTIFVSVAGIQSIAASGADGLTIKLTKFATSNLIPVVGGILSESVETVMNCSVLIKNSVGILGVICLMIIAAVPLIKIGAILIIFRLTAAVVEPISDSKIVSCLSEIANSVSILFSMLAACIVMFIIVLTIVINAGNTVIMLGR